MCKTNPEVDVSGEAELHLFTPLLRTHADFCSLFCGLLPETVCVSGGGLLLTVMQNTGVCDFVSSAKVCFTATSLRLHTSEDSAQGKQGCGSLLAPCANMKPERLSGNGRVEP